MTQDELTKWANAEIAALIAAGVAPLDAENTLKRVLAKLPDGVDPRTWIPPVQGGNVEITSADIEDARAAWYSEVEPKFARLLDAMETEE